MVTRREAAHDGAHERVNDWQTPRSYRPGALMDAQADVSIFDIPAQARAPRSFDGWWTQSWNRGAAQPKNVAQSGSEQFRSSPRTSRLLWRMILQQPKIVGHQHPPPLTDADS